MLLAIGIFDRVNGNTLFVNDISSVERALCHLAVHVLLASSPVDLENGGESLAVVTQSGVLSLG